MTKRKDPKDLKKVGRKTDYRPKYIKAVAEYIDHCNNTPEGEERQLPSRVGLALLLKVDVDTLSNWGKVKPKFFSALNDLDATQQLHLINRSFNGTGNANIGKMLLSANHGLREKTEIEHSGGISVIIDK